MRTRNFLRDTGSFPPCTVTAIRGVGANELWLAQRYKDLCDKGPRTFK